MLLKILNNCPSGTFSYFVSCLMPSLLKGSSPHLDTIVRYFAVHRPNSVSKSHKLGGMVAKMPQIAPTTPSQPKAPRSAAASRPSSRSTTPIPHSFDKPANDHTISFRPRLSQKEHPPDCPPLRVRWFYAVDVCSFIPLEEGESDPLSC